MSFAYGIEHEVAFLNADGAFADFSNTKFGEFDQIIQQLPLYENDYPQLRVGDAGIKLKRWYIEGFERFANNEDVVSCAPKGIEIRTTIHTSIQGAIGELKQSYELLKQVSGRLGFTPVGISFNPYQTVFEPDPPLNPYELQRREASPEMQTAEIPMLTYGPDLSISCSSLTREQSIDIGRKFTYYSPSMVPFSFSSPFFGGELWQGYSIRTFLRTGLRPAVLVFLNGSEGQISSKPSLTQEARVAAELGRIEFKAFDSCVDFDLYAALMALLKGLMLDGTLSGRATTPDAGLHQRSARVGFDDQAIYETACQIMEAAVQALVDDPDGKYLAPLQNNLNQRKTPAHELIRRYHVLGTLTETLRQADKTALANP